MKNTGSFIFTEKNMVHKQDSNENIKFHNYNMLLINKIVISEMKSPAFFIIVKKESNRTGDTADEYIPLSLYEYEFKAVNGNLCLDLANREEFKLNSKSIIEISIISTIEESFTLQAFYELV